MTQSEGILLVNKPKGRTSFSLVADARRKTGIRTIGHAGTLDPFATGVMVLLIGKAFTKLSNQFISHDKEYLTTIQLGQTTDTYDCEGEITSQSNSIPTLEDIQRVLTQFQGEIEQIPPMYSAKKVNGKKLYELARKGIEIERQPIKIQVETTFVSYEYPFLKVHVRCTKGTYIRSMGHDIGQALGCGGFLLSLERQRSGPFGLHQCLDGDLLRSAEFSLTALRGHLLCGL